MGYPGRLTVARVGIGAPPEEIAEREASLGGFDAQRLFDPGVDLTKGPQIVQAWGKGRLALHSTKPRPWTWDDVAAGRADRDLGATGERLAALDVPVVEIFNHEPVNDGAATSFARAATRALPLLCQGDKVTPALNLNGFAFGAGKAPNGGHTDDQLAQWVPDSLLEVVTVLTIDAYQADRNSVVDLLERFEQWAASRGVFELGIGELGTFAADDLALAFGHVLSRPAFGIVCAFDSERNINRPGVPRTVWRLLGDKLAIFQSAVGSSRALNAEPDPVPTDPRDAQILALTRERDLLLQDVVALTQQVAALTLEVAGAELDLEAVLVERDQARAVIERVRSALPPTG